MHSGISPWVRYLTGFFVACHGFAYIPFGILVPGQLKEWKQYSLALGKGITGKRLKRIIFTFHLATGILFIAAGTAIGFSSLFHGWWRLFSIAGAISGIISFGTFWDGQGKLFVQEGGIGVLISFILMVCAIALRKKLNEQVFLKPNDTGGN